MEGWRNERRARKGKRVGWRKEQRGERKKESGERRVEKGWEKSAFAFQINVDDGR